MKRWKTRFMMAQPAEIQQHCQAWIEQQGYYLANPAPEPSSEIAGSPD